MPDQGIERLHNALEMVAEASGNGLPRPSGVSLDDLAELDKRSWIEFALGSDRRGPWGSLAMNGGLPFFRCLATVGFSVRVTPQGKTELDNQVSNEDQVENASLAENFATSPTLKDAAGNENEEVRLKESSYMTYSALAEHFGLGREKVRKRLDRWRRTHHEGWIENPDRGPREPKYTYHVGGVRGILESMVASNERPAKKK